MIHSKLLCDSGINFSGEGPTTLTFRRHFIKCRGRPNEVHKMSFFLLMLYLNGFL